MNNDIDGLIERLTAISLGQDAMDAPRAICEEAASALSASQAEIVRLRDFARSIAEGNLGDGPGQANYARIRHVASAALSSGERADG
jgi:hypothetical protein